MAVQDVYFLTLHEPYEAAEHPVPINATIVHALSLLHPAVPQPDGGMIYRCLTEFPDRAPGCIVPLSTLTFELNGGRWWHMIGDWEKVSAAVVHIARTKQCDALPVGLPQVAAALLSGGPTTVQPVIYTDGRQEQLGGAERQAQLVELARHVHTFAAQGAFWPGNDLVAPPSQPAQMPYRPYQS